jgi:hypothetical protein
MAGCPRCGNRLAFGAKRSVAPALEVSDQVLNDLKRASADDGAKADPALQQRLTSLRSEGEGVCRSLHNVAHKMSAERINWAGVQRWLDKSTDVLSSVPTEAGDAARGAKFLQGMRTH